MFSEGTFYGKVDLKKSPNIQLGKEELILKRIRESKRAYSRKEQRAELLIRNAQFIKEYLEKERMPEYEPTVVNYGDFCDRWGISQMWDGRLPSLAKSVKTKPGLIYHASFADESLDWEEIALMPNINIPDYLLIRIDPWTSLSDIKLNWRRIERMKKTIYGFSEKGKSNFARALCWYDLNKRYRLSLGKTMRLWIQEQEPYIQDAESFKITVREGIKRIERYIKRLTPHPQLVHKPE